jgi:C-terminal processing protease CtpA/Prc
MYPRQCSKLLKKLQFVIFISLLSTVTFEQANATNFGEKERRDIVESISKKIVDIYLFPDMAKQSADFIKDQLEKGEYDKIVDADSFATKLTGDLQSINHDQHMRVWAKKQKNVERNDEAQALTSFKRERFSKEHNNSFQKVERLEGNVGYLDFRAFDNSDSARETAAAALAFLSNIDALIIDMRNNRGGSPNMVQFICSYFFKERTHLNSMYWPNTAETQEFWTLDTIPGHRMSDVPLYILTSKSTFSAAEEFTYDLKAQKRAVVVGETTAGGANSGKRLAVNGGFDIFIPSRRPINPITGTNWEGVGVQPDFNVPAESAFDKAYELAKLAAEKFRNDDIENKMIPIRNMQKEFEEKLSKIIDATN